MNKLHYIVRYEVELKYFTPYSNYLCFRVKIEVELEMTSTFTNNFFIKTKSYLTLFISFIYIAKANALYTLLFNEQR